MLNRIRAFREQGWTGIAPEDYRVAWQRWGGSVATHPDVVHGLSELAGIRVDYLGWFAEGQLQAAIPAWGRHIALSRAVLKKEGKRGVFDLGNAEVILPQSAHGRIVLRHSVRYLSELHAGRIIGLSRQKESLAMARAPEEYGSKFRYNQRREERLLEESGGRIRPISELSAPDIAAMYRELFEKRWGFAVPGKDGLERVFALLRPLMTGSYVTVQGQSAAIQILYRAESPEWVSVEYINGGVDPAWNALSPGSVLSFVNTRDEWARARARQKQLRYSFGRADRGYKARWCHTVPAYEAG
ncbi:MAG TPA: GNAT family N-acetyltransferase [Candidatus Desulfobacillus sp.]|nr:GNAT family N-acetyltransferase [Candidatus Desulfobacillus sp.]